VNDTLLFIWGVVVFLFAVGPLVGAAYLDYRERNHKLEIERAAGLGQPDSS